jgi:hypothetical protein
MRKFLVSNARTACNPRKRKERDPNAICLQTATTEPLDFTCREIQPIPTAAKRFKCTDGIFHTNRKDHLAVHMRTHYDSDAMNSTLPMICDDSEYDVYLKKAVRRVGHLIPLD